jgi:hypothetical protein
MLREAIAQQYLERATRRTVWIMRACRSKDSSCGATIRPVYDVVVDGATIQLGRVGRRIGTIRGPEGRFGISTLPDRTRPPGSAQTWSNAVNSAHVSRDVKCGWPTATSLINANCKLGRQELRRAAVRR